MSVATWEQLKNLQQALHKAVNTNHDFSGLADHDNSENIFVSKMSCALPCCPGAPPNWPEAGAPNCP